MLRTVIWFAYFGLYLIFKLPALARAKRLDREGRTLERDKYVDGLVKAWSQSLVRLAGGQITVSGEDHVPGDQPVVFISNHQGNFDIPILLGYIKKPKAFISKIEVLKMPMIRSWMRLMNCAFMDRKDIRQSLQTINLAVESIQKGYSMVIFPEGTRSKGGPMRKFKPGSFKLALKSDAILIPVTIEGSYSMMETTGFIHPGQVHVTLHPGIPTRGMSKEEKDALPERVWQIIHDGLMKADPVESPNKP